MRYEQQQIAIAKACGWKTGYRDPEAWHPLPDFLHDLNAMHEAEKVLTPDTRPEYLCQLFDAATRGRSGLYPVDENYLSHHATASQRAEAFLRTIGKWEESK